MRKYKVTGMSCSACSARVEKAVSGLDTVSSCSVNLLTGTMAVEGPASDEEIYKAVTDAGYGIADTTEKGSEPASQLPESEVPVLKKRLISSLIFLVLLLYVSMGGMMWGWPLPEFLENHMASGLFQLLVSTAILVINQKFFISGFKGLIHRAPNMDTLVSMGAAAAYIYSTIVLFNMTSPSYAGDCDLYFESAGTILTLITLGKMLEAISKGRTTDALKGLMELAPSSASVIRDDREITLPVSEIKEGEIYIVRPGERVPLDGSVISGAGAVDESALTGESIPSDKEKGSIVYAGTTNMTGTLKCQVTAEAEDTTLSQIIQMVSDASATKAPAAKIADKVSGIFVPAVICIAAVTCAAWLIAGSGISFALARAISVLVISCPCALGLATPVAIMAGSGVGAKNGILFKTAESLENTGKADIAVLDKTGTVTEGRPQVADILPLNGTDETDFLKAAYSLEYGSEHPLAAAVREKAKERGLIPEEVTDFKIHPGGGLECMLNGSRLYGGNIRYISEYAPVSEDAAAAADRLSGKGVTPLFFACDGKLTGIIGAADRIRDDSKDAVKKMHDMGLEVVLLTGDSRKTAEAVGKACGADDIIAEVLPDEKENVIRKLKEKGKVLMVGDGINDAPALTSADTGIAVGAGTDIAIDAADVVLMHSRLSDVTEAVRLSRLVLRNIRQNLFWAFIYNVIGIPLAAGVFIPLFGWQLNPMFAAAAMSLSSFCVVTNALRINLFKRDKTYEDEKGEEDTMIRTMKIEGMMCQHCEMHTKKALEALEGVEKADVSHEKGTAVVSLAEDVPDSVLRDAVTEAGYEVKEII